MLARNLSLSFGTKTVYDMSEFTIGPRDHASPTIGPDSRL